MYKAADGGSFGTKNLIDLVRQCKGSERSGQLTLMQTMHVSKPDVETWKQKEVQFCAAGYHSFLSVENSGFKSVLQALTGGEAAARTPQPSSSSGLQFRPIGPHEYTPKDKFWATTMLGVVLSNPTLTTDQIVYG